MRKHYPLDPLTGAENQALLPWSDGIPATGTLGSYPGQALVTDQEAELLNAFAATGLIASGSDLTQLAQAISTGIFVGAFGGTANALVATLPGSVQFPALVPGMRFHGIVTAANTGAVTLKLNGIVATTTAQPAHKMDGVTELSTGDLRLGTAVTWFWDGAAFRLVGFAASNILALLTTTGVASGVIRQRLTANLTLYVATSGSDTTGDGSQGNPWATTQRAASYAIALDCAGFSVKVKVADGTYTAGAIALIPLTGSPNPLQFEGNLANPSNCVINVTGNTGLTTACFASFAGGSISVKGFRLKSAFGSALYAQGTGAVITYGNCVFDTCPNGHHIDAVLGGEAFISADCTIYQIVGNAIAHFFVSQAGTIYNNAATVGTLTISVIGTPSITIFANAMQSGTIKVPGLAFSGGVVGQRYFVDSTSSININGGGAGYFPGTTAGTVGTSNNYG